MINLKKRIYTIIFVSIASCLFAEDTKKYLDAFNADSVVWTNCYELDVEGLENTISKTIIYGDTTINNVKWKILNFYTSSISPIHTKGLIRTENSKVIYAPYPGQKISYRVNEETIAYDFGNKDAVKVDSIKLNDGQMHKRIYLTSDYYIIEGLGDDKLEPFWSLVTSIPTMPSFSTLVCCQVNGELLYINPNYLDCDGSRVANEPITALQEKAKITHADGSLRVIFDGETPFDVTVYNMQGATVAQRTAQRSETTIPTGGLSQGVYVVKVTAGDYSYSRKFIK